MILKGKIKMEKIDSILLSIRQMLGTESDYDPSNPLDTEIMVDINSALSVLSQITDGIDSKISISSEEDKWSDFFNEDKINMAKTYVYLDVKLSFDPPSSASVVEMFKEKKKEIAWRLETIKSNNETVGENK